MINLPLRKRELNYERINLKLKKRENYLEFLNKPKKYFNYNNISKKSIELDNNNTLKHIKELEKIELSNNQISIHLTNLIEEDYIYENSLIKYNDIYIISKDFNYIKLEEIYIFKENDRKFKLDTDIINDNDKDNINSIKNNSDFLIKNNENSIIFNHNLEINKNEIEIKISLSKKKSYLINYNKTYSIDQEKFKFLKFNNFNLYDVLKRYNSLNLLYYLKNTIFYLKNNLKRKINSINDLKNIDLKNNSKNLNTIIYQQISELIKKIKIEFPKNFDTHSIKMVFTQGVYKNNELILKPNEYYFLINNNYFKIYEKFNRDLEINFSINYIDGKYSIIYLGQSFLIR